VELSREMPVTWRVPLPRSSRGGVWLVSQVRSNPGRWHSRLRPNGKGEGHAHIPALGPASPQPHRHRRRQQQQRHLRHGDSSRCWCKPADVSRMVTWKATEVGAEAFESKAGTREQLEPRMVTAPTTATSTSSCTDSNLYHVLKFCVWVIVFVSYWYK
jgi:hypothetical protein